LTLTLHSGILQRFLLSLSLPLFVICLYRYNIFQKTNNINTYIYTISLEPALCILQQGFLRQVSQHAHIIHSYRGPRHLIWVSNGLWKPPQRYERKLQLYYTNKRAVSPKHNEPLISALSSHTTILPLR
jgi:hypothetical protein